MAAHIDLIAQEVPDSVDLVNNTSQISVIVNVWTNNGTYNESGNTLGSITIDGVNYSLAGTKYYKNTTTTIFSTVITVPHTQDGSRSVYVSYEYNAKVTSTQWLYGSTTVTLTKIARPSEITSSNVFVVRFPSTITVDKKDQSFTHTIRYVVGRTSGIIGTEKMSETSITWTPPTSLFLEMIGKYIVYGTISIETFSNGVSIGYKSYELKLGTNILYNVPQITQFSGERGTGTGSSWVSNEFGTDIKISLTCVFTDIPDITTYVYVYLGGTHIPFSTITSGVPVTLFTTLPADQSADLVIKVFDNVAATETNPIERTITVSTTRVPLNINLNDNGGVGIGKLAEYDGVLDVAMEILAREGIKSSNASDRTNILIVDKVSGSSTTPQNVVTYFLQKIISQYGAGNKTSSLYIGQTSFDYSGYVVAYCGQASATSTGLPQYAFGVFQQYDSPGNIYTFKVDNGVITYFGSGGSNPYPVGAIYMSVNNTDPSTLFGGTWQRIQDRFLLAAGGTYSAGSTGGNSVATLTVDNLPPHTHGVGFDNDSSYGGGSMPSVHRDGASGADALAPTSSTGSGYSFSIMPPYLTVYMWQRIA